MSKKKAAQTQLFAEVCGRKIPVANDRTWIDFTAGDQGEHEAGRYCFWYIFGEDEFGPWQIFGRALESLPPEDRFTRMAHERLRSDYPAGTDSLAARASYESSYRRLPTARGIRAATYREISIWMDGHRQDALYARPNWVCQGQQMFGLPPLATV